MFKSTFSIVLHLGLALAATFPPPSGLFNTSLSTHQLTDHSRLDPYSSTPTPRTLMISIFHPQTCIASPTPYMDPLTASWTDSQFAEFGIPAGTFGSLYLQTCPSTLNQKQKTNNDHHELEFRVHKKHTEHFPLVLFSPGLGNPRLYYTALAQELASQGYIVITVDHPYDAGIVVFPDNSTVLGANISSDAQILQALGVRVKDVSFILNHLASHHNINERQVGIFGHSLGGATAAQAMLSDGRLKGGVNLDGTFFGSVISSGFEKPFLLFAHENKTLSTDASWGAIWPELRGWKRLLEVKGSAHGTFTDLPDVVDVLGLSGMLPPEVGELLGTIDGRRAMRVVGTYVGAFFDFLLKGKKGRLLEGESEEFPEVVFESDE